VFEDRTGGLQSHGSALEAGDLPDLARVTVGQVFQCWLNRLMFTDFSVTGALQSMALPPHASVPSYA